jgi:HK97 family phage major capsid protein
MQVNHPSKRKGFVVNIDNLIASVEAGIKAKLDERSTHTKAIEEVRSACLAENRDPSADEATTVSSAMAARSALDAEVEVAQAKVAEYRAEKARDEAADKLAREITPGAGRPAYDKVARTGQEPRTYTEQTARGGVSFFGDAYRFQTGDMGARERLERHGNEVKVEREMSERATSTSSFAGLIVPQYLVDQAALVARAGRPFANTVQKLQLPDQGTQFQIPQGTTGAATAIQATENASVQSTDEVWANVTVNVATIAGQQDVSRQSLERGTPGIDSLIYLDLAGAYAANLDSQVLTGSGSSGQILGVQNTSSINAATAFGAAVTATNFFTKVAGQVQAVAANRFMAADSIVMHPRRWGWYLSQIATDGRPLAVPNNNGPTNAQATYSSGQPYGTVVGALQGLPVITDANIPTTAGTINEDLVFVYRSADLLLWEDGDGMPKELRFEQTLGNQLTTKLVVYGYAAFTAGRYPKAVGKVGGLDTTTNGLIAPTF